MGSGSGGVAIVSGDADDSQRFMQRASRLTAEIGELKRVRRAGRDGSVTEALFRTAWAMLCAGQPARSVADHTTAAALVACQLGAIDDAILEDVGLLADERLAVLLNAFDLAAAGLPGSLAARLRGAVGQAAAPTTIVPGFVDALARQPRAGATAPGHPRLVLEPSESHADHCLAVAVAGVLLAEREGADPARVFVAGLAHHLHNARLPDSGFAGEMLLGDRLEPVMRRLFDREIATLPEALAPIVRDALTTIVDAGTPEGRSFHIADVFDRVLQVRYHDRVASFRAEQALHDMDLVHAGPLQAFHKTVLRQVGLL